MNKNKESQKVENPFRGATKEVQEIKYVPGKPLSYRWNAKTNKLTVDWITGVIEISIDGFKFCPIKLRVFEGKLFGSEKVRKWVELFFVNELGVIGNILFHGPSVERLQELNSLLEYAEQSICRETIIELHPKEVKGQHGTYYIMDFKAVGTVNFDFAAPENLYRQDTEDNEATGINTVYVDG